MKKVYKVLFPCGHFYIGCTKQPLEIRLYAHLHNPYTNKFADFIKEQMLGVNELLKLTGIIYEGKSATYYEQSEIFKERENPLMLNTRIMKNEPQLTKRRRRKHLIIGESPYSKFKEIAKLKGMTHEGLMKYFIDKETK